MASLLFLSCFAIVLFCTGHVKASYQLVDNYSGNSFFSAFTFFTVADPTHGYVTYESQSQANSAGYTFVDSNGRVNIDSDHTNVASGAGRNSVRITSNKSYNGGLFLFDIQHMPWGCGTWPAVWLVGPNWPNSGEIDVIEGVNNLNYDSMTLHTKPGCTIPSNPSETGRQVSTNCDATINGNSGCGVQDPRTSSYGSAYNSNGGGVHALLWTTTAIQIWFFPRNAIPSDITNGSPNPSGWGTPAANFPLGSNCPSSFFSNMQIVVDNTFCGDWAGGVYASDNCPDPSSCQSYVQNNPSAFTEAYWAINSFKVYQSASTTATTATTATHSTTATTATTATHSTTSTSTTSSSSGGQSTSGCGSGLLYCPGNKQCYSSSQYVCGSQNPYLCPTGAPHFCNGGCSANSC